MQVMQYTMFVDLQLTEVLMSTVRLLEVDLMVLQVYMNGQMLQSLHFFMPGCVLTGLLGAMGGTLALITLSFMLGGICMQLRGGGGTPP